MKTRSLTSYVAVTLCLILITIEAYAGIPSADQVAKYERFDAERGWQEVTQAEGKIILGCLRNIDSFASWGSTVPSNIVAQPIRTDLGFRITRTSGSTNLMHFSSRGELLHYPDHCDKKGLLVLPEEGRMRLAQLFAQWREQEHARIVSQPLPCKYRIGSASDGGTLLGIARLFYGDTTKWKIIYEANKSTIRNPNVIYDGTVITIPKLIVASNKKDASTGDLPIRSNTNRTSSAKGSRPSDK
jgi:hypothetical protein